MLFSSLVALTMSVVLPSGTPVRPAVDSLPFDTTQVIITPADFTQLEQFLTATKGLRDTLGPKWAEQPQLEYQLPATLQKSEHHDGSQFINNYVDIAAKTPAMAKAFDDVKLTPSRYMQLCRTLHVAQMTDRQDHQSDAKPSAGPDTTILGKNIDFLHAHEEQFATLQKLGLDVSTSLTVLPSQIQFTPSGMGFGGGLNKKVTP